MNGNKACIFAYKFDSAGKAEAIDPAQSHDHLVWIHLDARAAGIKPLLDKIPGIDALSASALLASETRPRLEKVGNGLLIILRGPNLNENARPDDMVSLRLWVDAKHIVSLRRRKSKAVDDFEGQVRAGTKTILSPGDFLASLCISILDKIEPIITALDQKVDNIEEKILKNSRDGLRHELTLIRQQAIIFRRHMGPQREVLSQLKALDEPWFTPQERRILQDSYDRITRFIEELDMVRDRCQIMHEELAALFSEKMNSNMFTISLLSALFMPLGFLTGLFGINVGGIPGADNPIAFMVFCIALGVVIGLQMLIFRRMKWF